MSLVLLGIAGTVVYKYVHDRIKDEVLRQLQSTVYNFNTQLNLLLSKKEFGVIDYSSDGFIRDCVEQMSLMSPEYSHISEKLNNHLLINKKPLDPDIIEMETILLKDGKEVMEYFRKVEIECKGGVLSQFSMVVLDLNLSKINGIEVLKFLKRNPKFSLIPVVIMSTSSDQETIDEAYRNGANGYITKPANYEEFVSKIRTLKEYC